MWGKASAPRRARIAEQVPRDAFWWGGASDLGRGPSQLPFTLVLALDGACWWCEARPEASHAPLSVVVQRRRMAGPSLQGVPEGKLCQQRADRPSIHPHTGS